MSKALIKQAERNVINQAKAWSDAMQIIDALRNFGNMACHDHIAKETFSEGVDLIRRAMYAEQSEALRNCFAFVGVGGEEAEKFSREMFMKVFDGGYSIMQFLDRWGHIPRAYKIEDKEKFKEEITDVVNEIKEKE